MERKSTKHTNLESILEKYIIVKKDSINENDVELMISEINTLIEMNTEIGFIDDIREDVLKLKSNNSTESNILIRGCDIESLKLNDLTNEVLKKLEEQGLLLVIELNNNIYIDIDYSVVDKLISKHSLLEQYAGVVESFELLQKTSFVDANGIFKDDVYKEVYHKLCVDADFQKNKISFEFMKKALCELDLICKIYRKNG